MRDPRFLLVQKLSQGYLLVDGKGVTYGVSERVESLVRLVKSITPTLQVSRLSEKPPFHLPHNAVAISCTSDYYVLTTPLHRETFNLSERSLRFLLTSMNNYFAQHL